MQHGPSQANQQIWEGVDYRSTLTSVTVKAGRRVVSPPPRPRPRRPAEEASFPPSLLLLLFGYILGCGSGDTIHLFKDRRQRTGHQALICAVLYGEPVADRDCESPRPSGLYPPTAPPSSNDNGGSPAALKREESSSPGYRRCRQTSLPVTRTYQQLDPKSLAFWNWEGGRGWLACLHKLAS